MAIKDFELYSKIRIFVYDVDTAIYKMKKVIRPVLGDNIRNQSYDLIKEVNLANSSCATDGMPKELLVRTLESRIVHIDNLLADLKSMCFLIEMAQDKKYLSEKSVCNLARQSVIITRMAVAWSKQTKNRLISITGGD